MLPSVNGSLKEKEKTIKKERKKPSAVATWIRTLNNVSHGAGASAHHTELLVQFYHSHLMVKCSEILAA